MAWWSSSQVYWKHGNGVSFLQLVQNMTGAPLAGDSWVDELRQPLEDRVTSEKTAFEKGLEVPLFDCATIVLCHYLILCHQTYWFSLAKKIRVTLTFDVSAVLQKNPSSSTCLCHCSSVHRLTPHGAL